MDKIFLKRLEADCVIGIFKRERVKRQKVWIDLELACDARDAARKDLILSGVNYKKIAKSLLKWTKRSRFHLIESLAEYLAKKLLTHFPLRKVTLTVSKPGAVRFAENVGVKITREAEGVDDGDRGEWAYINVGSNIEKERKIRDALVFLGREFEIGARSSTYESSPSPGATGGSFWNLIVKIRTDLEPLKLKTRLLSLERRLGRRRTGNKSAPRTIDLDIVYYGSSVIRGKNLTLPHPDAHLVPYMLIPMVEVDPTFRHPLLGRTMAEILGGRLDKEGHFRRVMGMISGPVNKKPDASFQMHRV